MARMWVENGNGMKAALFLLAADRRDHPSIGDAV